MEVLISILLAGIVLNTVLKISFWQAKYRLLFSVLVGLFVMYVYPIATEQSQTELKWWLEDTHILSTIAVIVTIESMLYIGFCFLSLKDLYIPQKSKRFAMLKAYSGLLIFPMVFYVTAQSMFYFTGIDFFILAVLIALGVTLGIFIMSYFVRWLLPEKDIRLEMLFLASLLVTGLGLISTANGNIVYVPKNQSVNYKEHLFTFLLFIVVFAIGFVVNRIKWKYFRNRKNLKKV
ncbi:hypothetical protein [Capnocytophaga felis]|uniref:Uncharacterized protein n=1 Tax=Capnocytophaga felis TaxID=2267611 RepID=A0A5M4B7M9_9FLAO|nr:hypothetical protein [Capnocytophaga felis]GET45370.1 hypothetical protein RCZ01_06720 [Capnocytophaga felis]GET47467.1 hypothetical protein RCZ02_02980 [Capnocytophaga felis]